MKNNLYYRVIVNPFDKENQCDISKDIDSLALEEDDEKPNELTIEISDPYKRYSSALQEFMKILVDVGTVDDHSIVFVGHIYQVIADFPADSVPTVKITAYDKSMQMGLRKHNCKWTNKSLKDIVNRIASRCFDVVIFESSSKTTKAPPEESKKIPSFKGNGIRQDNVTDLQFLMSLAADYGYEMYVDLDTSNTVPKEIFVFRTLKASHDEPSSAKLFHARCGVKNSLNSFEVNGDIRRHRLAPVFSGMDYEEGKINELEQSTEVKPETKPNPYGVEHEAEMTSKEPNKAMLLKQLQGSANNARKIFLDKLGKKELEMTCAFTTQGDLSLRAKKVYSKGPQGLEANGSILGNHRLRAHKNIEIADVGDRFSGKWYLTNVTHTLNQQSYQTEFKCKR